MASGIKALANSIRVSRLTAVALATLACQGAWSQIKVEPANWWVGMKSPEVQIMLHDKDIANLTPTVDTKGVSIKDITRTDNPNYLFVTLSIGSRAKAGNVTITLSGDGKETTIEYPLLTRRDGSSLRTGFSSDDAIYLVMPDRFANANPTNDTVEGMKEKCDRNEPYGRHGGDIEGVINHLDYIQDLGMTALWMTPFMTNDMPQSSYHGYAITNYYEVDAPWHTRRHQKALGRAAQARNEAYHGPGVQPLRHKLLVDERPASQRLD